MYIDYRYKNVLYVIMLMFYHNSGILEKFQLNLVPMQVIYDRKKII